jgi:hypothetical protein
MAKHFALTVTDADFSFARKQDAIIRESRQTVLGPNDDRQLADWRRSGTVEGSAGKADPASVSSKMANTLSASNRLHHPKGNNTC